MTILTARLENPAGYGRIVRKKAGSDDVKAIVEQKGVHFPFIDGQKAAFHPVLVHQHNQPG